MAHPPHKELKSRQRAERAAWPEFLALRVHRALSWLNCAEQCEDEDGRFVFLWIAINAAYANELDEQRQLETRRFGDFLERVVQLDAESSMEKVLWEQFPGPVRVLLNNRFVFQPFWDHHNRLPESDDWAERFEKANRSASAALAARDTGKVLGIVFARLYTLRNQLVHGGATWNSSVNRDQLRDANAIMGALVPQVIRIMMDNASEHWGEPCYPVVPDA
jgi:hypothetical protein